jgi:hypothetical protein
MRIKPIGEAAGRLSRWRGLAGADVAALHRPAADGRLAGGSLARQRQAVPVVSANALLGARKGFLCGTANPGPAAGTAGAPPDQDLFSARIGRQVNGVYGIDLAALCIKPDSG